MYVQMDGFYYSKLTVTYFKHIMKRTPNMAHAPPTYLSGNIEIVFLVVRENSEKLNQGRVKVCSDLTLIGREPHDTVSETESSPHLLPGTEIQICIKKEILDSHLCHCI